MHYVTLFVFTALVAVAMATAAGQFYVPRSYYVIDAEGHESAPVPLRRLRRSLGSYPMPYAGANANANANAEAWGGSANANANAKAYSGSGGWGAPGGSYGSGNPLVLRH